MKIARLKPSEMTDHSGHGERLKVEVDHGDNTIFMPRETVHRWATAAAEDVVERIPEPAAGALAGRWKGDEMPVQFPEAFCPRCLSIGQFSPLMVLPTETCSQKGYPVEFIATCRIVKPGTDEKCGFEATWVFESETAP